jgi:cytochrome c553
MLLPSDSGKKTLIYNILFVAVSAGILVFLLNAPPETTVKLPADETHRQFYDMGKKEAEKHCGRCHDPDMVAPLPEGHPPKYRCLFCHKKVRHPDFSGKTAQDRE